MNRITPLLTALLAAAAALAAPIARAHPIVEHALEVVIEQTKVGIRARIAEEQVRLIEAGDAAAALASSPADRAAAHVGYVLRHLKVLADGKRVEGAVVGEPGQAPATSPTSLPFVVYRLEYPLSAAPGVVRIEQDFLRELEGWAASCVVKVRQGDQPTFQTALLTRERALEFGCDWAGASKDGGGGVVTTAPVVAATGTQVRVWPTVREYAAHGVHHILTGFDHLLFVAALVLAAASLWDVVKVVTAFTVAHTLTLTVSVLDWLTLGDRVVEPVIAASIVFVAVQNVIWPGASRGWIRLAVAFAFGLFHGLGFAGGLQEAMSDLPPAALGAALGGFSLGVEAGHQVVVIPLFALLWGVRRWGAQSRERAAEWVTRTGSAGVAVGGVYFLVWVVKELF